MVDQPIKMFKIITLFLKQFGFGSCEYFAVREECYLLLAN